MPGSPAQTGEPATDDHAEAERLLDAIAQGIADAGRVHPHDEVVARMRSRFAGRSK